MSTQCINEILSEDALDCIFSLLPERDLLNCSKACRQWNRIAADKRYWKNLATQVGVPDPFRHDDLRGIVGRVFKTANKAIKEAEENRFWKNAETPNWMLIVYDRRLLRFHSDHLQELRNRKWKEKEDHKDIMMRAFRGYLGYYLLGYKTEERAFETACRLKESYHIKEALEQLGKVFLSKGNANGALRVAHSLPNQQDRAALFVEIVEYLFTHNRKKQAEKVHKMIPHSCMAERNRAAKIMAG